MRTVLAMALLLMVGIAQSQNPSPSPIKSGQQKEIKSAQTDKKTQKEIYGSQESPAFIKIIPAKKTPEQTTHEAYEHDEKPSLDRGLTYGTIAYAAFTFFLFLVTSFLAIFTYKLWRDASETSKRQAREMQDSLAIAKQSADASRDSADAAVSAEMPFLYPRASQINLHPMTVPTDAQQTHVPSVFVDFRNIGKTPAILTRVGVKFILTEQDQLPTTPPTIEEINSVGRDDVIAPDGTGGGRKWPFERQISADEIRRLIGDTKGNFLRFYVVGYVIYYDVFDSRHVRRFCMKVRNNGFQPMRGGEAYNRIQREKSPKKELPGTIAETPE